MNKIKQNLKAFLGRPEQDVDPQASETTPEAKPASNNQADVQNAEVKNADAPSVFCCPICYEVMSDPVVLATGHTYDRHCIQKWIAGGHRTCPVTGERLRHLEHMPNFALRNAVREWAEQNGIELKPLDVSSSTAVSPPDAPVTFTEPVPAQKILQGHDEIVWAIEVSGRRLFSASADKTIRVWDVDQLRCVKVLEDHTRPVLSLALSSGKLFSGSYDCSIRVWDLATLSRPTILEGHTDAVRALTVAGGKLFSGSYDSTIRVWDMETFLCIKILQEHTGPVRTLALAQGRVFSGSYDCTVCVWDIEKLEKVGTLEGHTEAVPHWPLAKSWFFLVVTTLVCASGTRRRWNA